MCNRQCDNQYPCIKVTTPGCECVSNYCRNQKQECVPIPIDRQYKPSESEDFVITYFEHMLKNLFQWYLDNVDMQKYPQPEHFLDYFQKFLIHMFEWLAKQTQDYRLRKYINFFSDYSFMSTKNETINQ